MPKSDGGFVAVAVGESIATRGDTWDELCYIDRGANSAYRQPLDSERDGGSAPKPLRPDKPPPTAPWHILSQMPDHDQPNPAPQPAATDVYAIHGADPEVLAYAMAKYSRSSLTMKESLAEISSQRAEQFLNTFYFQYGHRSIADLAHIPFAIERLSLLAAISLVDETRWDGQERSTRYQDFRKSGWYTPGFSGPQASAQRTAYTSAIQSLLHAYDHVGAGMTEALRQAIPKPAEMKEDAYTRTLKARAFDVARYLLPLATNTSLGQIVNARTLETQVSRLLASEFAEIRSLGARLRTAASEPAWNVTHAAAGVLLEEASSLSPTLRPRLTEALLRPVKAAPTLVKYSAPSEYALASHRDLHLAATELMSGQPIESAPLVDLVDDLPEAAGALEIELATSLLYPECHYSWRQLQRTVAALPTPRIAELIALGTAHRGRHDELLRPFSSGHAFKFDILMDIGGFRDMHRHRRCIQLQQDYTGLHGFDEPACPGQPTLAEAGLLATYTSAMDAALTAYHHFATTGRHPERGAPHLASAMWDESSSDGTIAPYLLPLGTRVRCLFKMDFAEALYIAELRSGPAGHFSYRRVAWEMYRAIARRHPALAPLFRIEDVNQPIDLLKR